MSPVKLLGQLTDVAFSIASPAQHLYSQLTKALSPDANKLEEGGLGTSLHYDHKDKVISMERTNPDGSHVYVLLKHCSSDIRARISDTEEGLRDHNSQSTMDNTNDALVYLNKLLTLPRDQVAGVPQIRPLHID